MTFRAEYHFIVEWGDTDPARIVFYPQFFRWFDAGTRNLFDAAGIPITALIKQYSIVGLPIFDTGAKFRRPAVFGDRLKIVSRVTEWTEQALKVEHRILKEDKLLATGYEWRVWAQSDPDDAARLQPLPIPEEIRRALE